MRIFLVRHGRTTGDVEERYGGDYDDSLTDEGRKQAQALAKKLIGKGVEAIFSSPKKRALETAQILQKALACDLAVVQDLRERNFYGILTGMKKSEAKQKHPKEVGMLESYKNRIEGAEDYDSFKARIATALEEMVLSKHKKIVIVTHGGPISTIFREVLKLGEFKRLGDCALLQLETDGKKFSLARMENAELQG
jgi:broad specificity phosphatase PhoE